MMKNEIIYVFLSFIITIIQSSVQTICKEGNGGDYRNLYITSRLRDANSR